MKSIDVVPTWYWPDGVPRYVSPPRSTVYRVAVERWARRTPQSTALVADGASIDYRTLDARVKLASARIRGAAGASGDDSRRLTVAVAARQGIDGAVAILGALHAGTDVLLLDPSTPDAEVEPVLSSFGCELLITEITAGARHGRKTSSVRAIAEPAAAEAEPPTAQLNEREPAATDRSPAARLGLRWGRSVVLQPNATLLGWSLAFRAFAMLDKDDLFTVCRPLATWEGVIGLFAPLVVGATAILSPCTAAELLETPDHRHATGLWLNWAQAEALASAGRARRQGRRWDWVYVSVDAPFSVRRRRHLARSLGTQLLTALGTPATGPIAGSPRPWLIDEAVGTPMTGIDLYPVDRAAGRLAAPPWPLLASASLGVKSEFFAPDIGLEPTAPGRFVSEDVLDIGVAGVIDANGFLYLV